MNLGVANFYLEMSSDSCSSQIQLCSLPQMVEVLSFWVVFIHLLKPQHLQGQGFFNKKVDGKTFFLSFFLSLFS